MRHLAQHALATGVVRLQLRARQPVLDHRAAARAGLRVVGQPHPRAGRRGGIQCTQTGIQRLVVGADRHQHDGQCRTHCGFWLGFSGSMALNFWPYSSVRLRASCGLRTIVGVIKTMTSRRLVSLFF